MADYAGAVAAIKDRLRANWTTTDIGFENGQPPRTMDADSQLVPWVFCAVVADGAGIEGFGLPGDHVVRERGAIEIEVMVPAGTGDDIARQYAVAIGEIFRARRFYDAEPPAYLRTWTPTVRDGRPGRSENPSGNWWCLPVSIPFEFYHRA